MPAMARRLALFLILCAAAGDAAAQPCERWVAPAPAGSDGNPGTLAQPWATLDHASASVPDDRCTVWFQNGVYSGTHSLYERFTTRTTFRAVNRYRAVLQHNGTVLKLFGARNMLFEGFEFRHIRARSAGALVVQVQQADGLWAENVTFRDNLFHDSYDNDLLKINNGARFITVESNVFYNQAGSDEHIDVNSVTDVLDPRQRLLQRLRRERAGRTATAPAPSSSSRTATPATTARSGVANHHPPQRLPELGGIERLELRPAGRGRHALLRGAGRRWSRTTS